MTNAVDHQKGAESAERRRQEPDAAAVAEAPEPALLAFTGQRAAHDPGVTLRVGDRKRAQIFQALQRSHGNAYIERVMRGAIGGAPARASERLDAKVHSVAPPTAYMEEAEVPQPLPATASLQLAPAGGSGDSGGGGQPLDSPAGGGASGGKTKFTQERANYAVTAKIQAGDRASPLGHLFQQPAPAPPQASADQDEIAKAIQSRHQEDVMANRDQRRSGPDISVLSMGGQPMGGPRLPLVSGIMPAATVVRSPAAVIQRQEAPPPPVTVSPEDRQRQLYAATIMHDVPPADATTKANLTKAVSFAPVYEDIQERDKTRQELERVQGELATANNQLTIATNNVKDVSGAGGGTGPGSGEPEKASADLVKAKADVARLSAQVELLAKEVKQQDDLVKKELAGIGVKDESELLTFVERPSRTPLSSAANRLH